MDRRGTALRGRGRGRAVDVDDGDIEAVDRTVRVKNCDIIVPDLPPRTAKSFLPICYLVPQSLSRILVK